MRVCQCECVCLWVWKGVWVYECVCVCVCLCVCRRVHVRVWNRFCPHMHGIRPVLFVAQAQLTMLNHWACEWHAGCLCIRLQEDVHNFVIFYKCVCVCVQSVHIWACLCAFVRVCAFSSVSLRERQREAVYLHLFCRWACKSTPKLSRAQHFSHTHFCYTHTYIEAMCTLYPFQHEHTGILFLRFSLHLSFFLLLFRLQEGEKIDREREKEWWCVLSLSAHIHSIAFTRTTSLSHSSLLHMYACHSHVGAWMLAYLHMFECMLPVDAITAYHVLTAFGLCICPQTVHSCMWKWLYGCDSKCRQRVDIERHSGTCILKQTPN